MPLPEAIRKQLAAISGVSDESPAQPASTQIIEIASFLAGGRELAKTGEIHPVALLISGSKVRILHGSPLFSKTYRNACLEAISFGTRVARTAHGLSGLSLFLGLSQ